MPSNKRKREKREGRVDRQEVKDIARRTAGGRSSTLILPEGIKTFYPKKKGTMELDIIGYEVSCNNHPDNVPAGTYYYRRPYKVHYGVGPDNKVIVCPTTIGKPCPICEKVTKLKEDYEDNEKEIKDIHAKQSCLFNILNVDDEVEIFDWSIGKFANQLRDELRDEETDSDDCGFYDIVNGRTLRVRFKESSWQSNKFLEANKIEFIERDDIPDDIADKALDLDKLLKILSYDEIKKLFYGIDDNEDEEEDSDEEKSVRKKSSRRDKIEEDDDEEDDEEDGIDYGDEDDEEEAPKKKQSRRSSKKSKSEPEEEDDSGDDDNSDDEEEEETPPKKTKHSRKKSKPEPKEDDDSDDEEDDDEDDEEEEKAPRKKSAVKKSKKKSKDNDDEEEDDEDMDFEFDDEE